LFELLDQEDVNEAENLLRYPPNEILVSNNNENIKIKISAHTSAGILVSFLALINLLVFFEKADWRLSFMLATVVVWSSLWIPVLYLLFKKIIIIINKNNQDYIFIGIGIIGIKYYLNWNKIINIYEYTYDSDGGWLARNIHIKEKNKLIKISLTCFNENKRLFLLKVLKYYWQNKNYLA
jgi:hypothetical protein